MCALWRYRWEKIVTWQFFHPSDRKLETREMGTIFFRPGDGLSLRMHDRKNPAWLNFDAFTPMVEQRVTPNAFFAFAPNDRSFHGASLDVAKWKDVANKAARRTFLGFVTAPTDGFHHFGGGGDWAPSSFSI